MNFENAASVLQTLAVGEQVEMNRGLNRKVVNDLFNGERPLTESEAEQSNISINCNWGEGPVLAAQARRQYTNAFQRPFRYFKVSIPDAPQDKQMEWSMFIGNFINKVLKGSLEYFYLNQYRFASVVAHGIGPMVWEDKESWLARFVPIEDLRVPTETEISFRNLEWFAVRYRYTEGELATKVFSENSSEHWNKPAIAQVLESYHDQNYNTQGNTWINQPERMAELIKQNGAFYASDAVPTIPLWNFYFKDRDEKTRKVKWKLRVVPDVNGGCTGAPSDQFLYDSGEDSVADNLSEILHCQYGDLNNKPPFMHYSVRSLGFLLVEPCYYTNLARCRTLQFLFESFNTWFRVVDPSGKARAMEIQLFDKAIIPEGVSIVPQNERHQVNPQVIEMVMSQLKQLMSEASASYTQASDTGTSREQTAYETSVKVAQVNAMMSGMLLVSFFIEKFAYEEICRRFCIRGSEDPDVREFQKKADEMGIPAFFLNQERWDIEPEIPMGAGNPTMELSQANQLMGLRPFLSPEAQDKVTHMAIAATTQNAALAQELKPLGQAPVASNGAKWASSIFATLMQGVPVVQNASVAVTDQVETLIGLLSGVVARVEQQTDLATPNEVLGLQTVSQYIAMLLQQMQQDPANAPKAKQFAQAMAQLDNIIKNISQAVAQKSQQSQPDPEAMANAQATMLTTQAKIQATQATTAQKLAVKGATAKQLLAHKNQAFSAEQARKTSSLVQDQVRANLQAGADIQREHVVTAVDLAHEGAKTDAAITRENKRSESMPKLERT